MTTKAIITRNALGNDISFPDGTYLSSENALIDGNRLCVPSAETLRKLQTALDVAHAAIGNLSVGTSRVLDTGMNTGRDLCRTK